MLVDRQIRLQMQIGQCMLNYSLLPSLLHFQKCVTIHNHVFDLQLHCILFMLGSPPHLKGAACYQDNAHEEWFIVELVLKLSKCYPDFVIRYAFKMIYN